MPESLSYYIYMNSNEQEGQVERVPQINENFNRCLCPVCPTYTSTFCADEEEESREKMFCSIGQASCALDQNGCICGDCPVWKEYELTSNYYCIKGEEMGENDLV